MEEQLHLTQEWDKTFPQNSSVEHRMVKGNAYTANKELYLIPGAVHTDLYDRMDIIPFDKMESFFRQYLV